LSIKTADISHKIRFQCQTYSGLPFNRLNIICVKICSDLIFTREYQMDLMLFILFIIAFFAATISAIAGFGSALILISASSLIFDIKWSIAMTTFFYFYNTSFKSYHFRSHINWPLVLKLSILAVPGVFIGAYCLLSMNTVWLSLGLGIMSLIYLCLDVFKRMPRIKVNDEMLVISGFIYGFISGAVGTGSLIKAMVFKQINMPKEAFVASMAASALPLNIIKMGMFISASLVVMRDIPSILILLLASHLGSLLGKRLLLRVPQEVFDILVRLILLVLSISLIVGVLY